jgi:uncharacterized protein YndB with AHSA1/START domain
MKEAQLPPIVRSISVSWTPEEAFRRFTSDFASWWPTHTHSIGGKCVERVVFECHAGGLIFEQHKGGRRFQWGRVLEWEPPRRVRFTWHPSRDASTAQEVELRFSPHGGGTRLELISTGWEKWGRGAPRARRGYSLGWGHILHVWAGRRTLATRCMDAVIGAIDLAQRLRGSSAAIDRAGGEIEASPEPSAQRT